MTTFQNISKPFKNVKIIPGFPIPIGILRVREKEKEERGGERGSDQPLILLYQNNILHNAKTNI